MKTNFKIGQFWRLLLRSEHVIQVKIWKWLKLLNSVPFTKKTLVNHIYIRIWWCWLTFTVLPWMKKNSKNNQFSRILLRSEYPIQVKIWNLLTLLNSVPFFKKPLVNQVYIRIWSFWLNSQFYSEWKKLQKYSIFKFTPKVRLCDFDQNLKMTKTS